jgi:uncharacterized protein
MDFFLAFITGLTTGGLSCLAVQGGLLASSIAHEVEQSVQAQPVPRRTKGKPAPLGPQPRAARPIALFLAAKLVAYTILGFFLGLLGSVLQLTPTMRAFMLGAIGVFMVGNALRMLNVHPIFRYFALEPPSSVTRYIRRRAKGEASWLTPVFLGVLTVLIPCGVTQAMMAVAIGSGNPVTGATLMFAFILGTTPVFFTVAYLATRLGARMEQNFTRIVAVVVLVLGLISIDSGLTLAGWQYSFTNLRLAISSANSAEAATDVAAAPAPAAGPPQPAASAAQTSGQTAALEALAGAPVASSGALTVTVRSNGYYPRLTHAPANQALKLALVTNKTYSCARAFVMPALGIDAELPATGKVVVDVPAQPAGSKLFFSCSMGMYSGAIVFDG